MSTRKILVIVESPGKIKKIESILGNKYIVKASYGHIIDLKNGGLMNAIDINNNFTPSYEIIKPQKNPKFKVKSKTEIVRELKELAKNAADILIATDEDREGEMIAWSLAYVLGLKNAKRIVFNSITKAELLNAINNPKKIDINLVNAQKTRRILDIIIGFELSPLVSKAIGGKLSAGRVQSVVTRLIIDKEHEINDFMKKESNTFFKCNANFNGNLKAVLHKKKQSGSESEKTAIAKIVLEKEARDVMSKIMKSKYKVIEIRERESIRQPNPPFITSTLQQEASTKLGFGVERTMNVAQKLYEGGHITYMRTDSVSLSKEAMDNIEKYVTEMYGEEYYRKYEYKSKSKNSQEAHEAIRPTDISNIDLDEDSNEDEVRLYKLIWSRAVASQMSPAIFNVVNVIVEISEAKEYIYMIQAESVKFPGYLRVYNLRDLEEETNEENSLLKTVPKKGEILTINQVNMNQDCERPTTRYSEATLVKTLEKLDIGRPSTYASSIKRVLTVGYVEAKKVIEGKKKTFLNLSWDTKSLKETKRETEIGKESNKLKPTETGEKVNKFLMESFDKIIDYKFTSDMEENLDEIARGKKNWVEILRVFYDDFHPTVEQLGETLPDHNDENGRVLGIHPEKECEIIAINARYGPVVKMTPESGKTIYAKIEDPLTLDEITLEEAIELFEYPKILGELDDNGILLKKGRYGVYIEHNGKKYNIPKNDDTGECDLTFENVVNIITEKNKTLLWQRKDGKFEYVVLDGKYGRCVSKKDTSKKTEKPTYARLPATADLDILTLENVKELFTQKKDNIKKEETIKKASPKKAAKGKSLFSKKK